MKRVSRSILILAYLAGLAFFYYKYVPLVKSYQLALVPILATVTFLAWLNPRAGTLLFIFLFPLINNLPYFFGIHEPIPQAPAALVLFLFYALGFLLRRKSMDENGPIERGMLRPIALFLIVVGVSALITFLRYANFFPFLSSNIYELAVNRQEPEFISGQIDQVATSMVQTERTMGELQFVTGLKSLDDEVPSILRDDTAVVKE